MIRKYLQFIIIFVAAGCLCGFRSGGEDVTQKHRQNQKQDAAVTKYEEVVDHQRSNRIRYIEYHSLIIISLDEANSLLLNKTKNMRRLYRMAHNAYNYLQLLNNLVADTYKNEFVKLNVDLKRIVSEVQDTNITELTKKDISKRIKFLIKTLRTKFAYREVKLWMKD
ncbi:MAG: hypothetical protein DRP78_06520 [Candidatus Omnitrophota bacterium]|nr:MAG: hypothetical protein DRP78_06520 [Candidatus Omnitrophota bacterium]